MTRSLLTRTGIGLLLVLLLSVGGYYRWNQLPVGVLIRSDAEDRPMMACGIQRKLLKSLPCSIVDGIATIETPISEWNLEIMLADPALWGKTMGTTYRIQVADALSSSDADELMKSIHAQLQEINRQMSTWDPESEISRFNHAPSTDPIRVSTDFVRVVERALSFSEASGGAFDPTLQPLLNLWGFGSEGNSTTVPSAEAIDQARAQTGWNKIRVASPTTLQKKEPGVSLALGAIAKGYGVDAVARLLDKHGFQGWFVEIGGEVAVKGHNPVGDPWRIGIQYPSTAPDASELQGILHLTSGAVATSGDYRNYIMQDGQIYSHILDPRSGRAVLSDTASVSVFAPNCTDADGIATALFVMGPEQGLAWIEKEPDIEALYLLRGPDGAIIEKISSGFLKATGYISSVE